MENILQIKIWDEPVGLMYWDHAKKVAVFEYDKTFVQKGLDIAPLSMSVHSPRSKASLPWTGNKDHLFQGLPPLFADSLPDKWGSILFSKWLSEHKAIKHITPLDQLSYIGKRGMGAIEYYPAHELGPDKAVDINLKELYEFARRILTERETITLRGDDVLWQDLIKIGTSAGGKHPKAIIAYNEDKKEIRSGQTDAPEGFRQYILKFDEPGLFPFTKIEYIYYLLAQKAGISMNPCRLIRIQDNHHFMTERFDRQGNVKIHMQTAAAMEPISESYEDLFRIMRQLKLSAPEFTELYRRMVFNVLAGNVDDHNKNFSFLMTSSGKWKLSPAYDLSFTTELSGPFYMNRHEMTINGKRENITYKDLEKIGKDNNISGIRGIIEQTREAVFSFREEAVRLDVNPDLIKAIGNALRKLDTQLLMPNNKMSFGDMGIV